MKVVACYSEGTPYEAESEIFRRSLDAVGMEHHVEGFPSQGDWYANTAHKAKFIEMSRRLLRGPLLYIDVDAFVHRNCADYFDTLAARGVDFGAHWFAGPAKGPRRSEVCACVKGAKCSKEHRLLSGTLFLGDTPGCKQLVSAWVAVNEALAAHGAKEGGGQKALWYALTCFEKLKVERLPGRYTYVFDKSWAYPPSEPCIIEHTIASRDNRGVKPHANAGRRARVAELRALVS